MTTVTRETITATTHRILVPVGSPINELQLALHWATQSATSLGLDTSYDDWARVTVDEDHLIIEITEPKRGVLPPGQGEPSSPAGPHYRVVVHLNPDEESQHTLTVLVDSDEHRYLRLLESHDNADPDAEEWFKICRALTDLIAEKLGHEEFALHSVTPVEP